MPIHFEDLDVTKGIAGCRSALIVPCNMCPAVTVAVRENRPFMQLARSLIKSPPFEEYLGELQSRLKEAGVSSKIFRSHVYHHWFMCMWTASRHRKLRREAAGYDAVIVLGCESATVTVRDSVASLDCKVIEGMTVTGIMNANLVISPLGNISFASHKTVPISGRQNDVNVNNHLVGTKLELISATCPPGAAVICPH